jgi:hypothetical protein
VPTITAAAVEQSLAKGDVQRMFQRQTDRVAIDPNLKHLAVSAFD